MNFKSIFQKLKKLKRVLCGKDFYYFNIDDKPMLRLGSDYGGWWILENSINSESIVISAGLGEDITFDDELINLFDCHVYGFDPTPKSIDYINSLNIGEKFVFNAVALATEDGVLSFNLPLNENYISGSLENVNCGNTIEVNSTTISSLMRELKIDNIDILKIDIEGSEYKVLRQMLEQKIFPKQILVEFHHFLPSFKVSDTREVIRLLSASGYKIFCIDGYGYSLYRDRS